MRHVVCWCHLFHCCLSFLCLPHLGGPFLFFTFEFLSFLISVLVIKGLFRRCSSVLLLVFFGWSLVRSAVGLLRLVFVCGLWTVPCWSFGAALSGISCWCFGGALSSVVAGFGAFTFALLALAFAPFGLGSFGLGPVWSWSRLVLVSFGLGLVWSWSCLVLVSFGLGSVWSWSPLVLFPCAWLFPCCVAFSMLRCFFHVALLFPCCLTGFFHVALPLFMLRCILVMLRCVFFMLRCVLKE